MKKKILSFLITILAVCTLMFTMTACGGKVEFKINFVVDGEVYAVVNTNGNELIKMPQDPSKEDYNFDGWFWDKDVWEKPFTANSLLDAPLSSNMSVYAKFSPIHVCAFTEEVANNDYIATNATCEDKATYYYSCTCGEKGTETFESGEALGHSFTNYEFNNDADCEIDGTETAVCDNGCGKDDTRTKTGSALNHTFSTPEYVWNENECTATRVCIRDSQHVESETVVATYVKDTDATCATVETGHYKAEFVNPAFTTQTTTEDSVVNGDVLGHSFGTPTYVWNGNECTATRVCSRDSAHVESEIVTATYVKDTDATCTTVETGHYKAEFVNPAFTTQTTTEDSIVNGDVLGHSFGTPTYVWQDNQCTATRVCSRNSEHVEIEAVTAKTVVDTEATCTTSATGHYVAEFKNTAFVTQTTGKDSVVVGEPNGHTYTTKTTESTCTAQGYTTYTCHCGDNYVADYVNAKGHNYNAPIYTWNENQCTATRICSRDSDHVESETITAEYVKDTNATCITAEKGHYVAEFNNVAFATQTTAKNSVTNGEALGHLWDLWKTNANGTHTRICLRDSEHKENGYCTGGTATCIELAKCSLCNGEYGDYKKHQASDTWTTTEKEHYHTCKTSGCSEKLDKEKHTFDKNKQCTTCGYITTALLGTEISSDVYSIDGTNLYVKVPNTQTYFAFAETINVAEGATYKVYTDIQCKEESNIPSYMVNDLVVGDNTYYFLVSNEGSFPKIYTVTVRRRPMYDVTFSVNGGTTVGKQVVEEDDFATEQTTTKIGYTFAGWDYDFNNPIIKNTEITASWVANTDTKYTVIYYLQNLNDNNYTPYETLELKGTTDTTATAEIKGYTHFTYNASKSTTSGNISPDGSRVLRVYYTRDSYAIVSSSSNAKAGTSTKINSNYKFEKEITLTATTNAGYTFLGWYEGETCVCTTEEFTFNTEKDVTYTATWEANKDTKYTVIYYLQNLNDNNYTPYETLELKGTTDTTATAEIKGYTHFTYNASKSTISGNIDGDGSRILSVYYTRDSYAIVSNSNNEKAGTITSGGNYKFEKEITLTATTNVGYTFLGWYEGETLVCETEEFIFKAEKDGTYTATWSANIETKYTVNYYLQNLENDNYTLYETIELTGTTDTLATADIREYTQYTCNESLSEISKNIDGDGSLILNVYYYLNKYSLSVNNEGAGSITNSGEYKYGKEVTTTATPYLGYKFIGWYCGDGLLSTENTYTFTVDKNVMAKFAVKAEMSKFNLISTTTTCSITGIIDKTITEIIVPNYVTSIGSYAFEDCTSLTSIVIPDSVTSIGDYAFEGCYKLVEVINKSTHITVENGSSSNGYVGYYALAVYNSNSGITKSQLTNDNGYIIYTEGNEKILVGYNGTETELVLPNYITEIYKYAFYNCSSLTNIEIPNSVTYIGSYAFEDCTSLTSIVIPDSVTYIGSYTFFCTSLTSIEIPNSVEYIGSYAFFCTSLTSVEIPNSVTYIDSYAFWGCDKLVEVINKSTHITVEKGSESNGYVGYYALVVYNSGDTFSGTKLSNDNGYIVYTEGNEKILVGYNGQETELTLPNYITKIRDYAFHNSDLLTSVTIGNGVTYIGSYAFEDCTSLTSIVIPDSVTSIGDYAFEGCYKLVEVINKSTHITVENGSSSNGYVGYYALAVYNSNSGITKSQLTNDNGYIIYTEGNEKILVGYNGTETELVLPNYITEIYKYAFYNCSSLTNIEIPNSVTYIGSYAFSDCSSLKSVVIPDSVRSIGDRAFYNCSSLTSVVIPDSVTSIGYSAFEGCSSLTSVVIPDTVTSISSSAFEGCSSLTSVVIPDTVTSISSSAFEGCSSLTSVVIPDSVTSIGSSAFYNCPIEKAIMPTLAIGYVKNSSLKEVVLTSGTSIGYGAFSGCSSLTSIEIPDTVTSIGDRVFYNCSSLTSVVIPDSVTNIGSSAFYNCPIEKAIMPTLAIAYVKNSSLKEVVLTSGTSIGSSAFSGCSSLTSIEIPDTVTSIGDRVFYGCTSLTSIKYRGTKSQWQAISKGTEWNSNTGNYIITYNYKGE